MLNQVLLCFLHRFFDCKGAIEKEVRIGCQNVLELVPQIVSSSDASMSIEKSKIGARIIVSISIIVLLDDALDDTDSIFIVLSCGAAVCCHSDLFIGLSTRLKAHFLGFVTPR